MGTGRFASPPDGGPDYRRGYLCGMIRGDGHLGSYAYTSDPAGLAGRSTGSAWLSIDLEALRRTRDYLARARCPDGRVRLPGGCRASGMQLDRDPHVNACRCGLDQRASSPGHAPHQTNGARGSWPGSSTPKAAHSGWRACVSAIPITAIVDQITSCLRRFGFSFTIETRLTGNDQAPSQYVRLLGGLREHLRFFHTVDPAITRKRIDRGHGDQGRRAAPGRLHRTAGRRPSALRHHHRHRRFRIKWDNLATTASPDPATPT